MLVLGLGGSWIDQPVSFPSLSLPSEAYSADPASSPKGRDSNELGQYGRCDTLVSGSPTLTPPVPALLFCLGEVYGPLSHLLQLVTERDSFLVLMPSRPVLLHATGGNVTGADFPYSYHYVAQKEGVISPPFLPSGPAHLSHIKRVNFIRMPGYGIGLILSISAAGERKCQFSLKEKILYQLQAMRSREGGTSSLPLLFYHMADEEWGQIFYVHCRVGVDHLCPCR